MRLIDRDKTKGSKDGMCHLLVLVLIWGCVCCFQVARAADEASSFSLQLVTFNIRYQTSGDRGSRNWTKRLPVAVEAVKKMNPDVMGVQE